MKTLPHLHIAFALLLLLAVAGGCGQDHSGSFALDPAPAIGRNADVTGTDDPAGALVFPDTLDRARAIDLNPAGFLANNDSGGFFARLGDLLVTGPTGTNVNDFRVLLVDP